MAQSGYTPILIYASGTASAVPSASNLTSSASGAELALNYADGKLYFKNSSGTVTLLAGSGGGGPAAGSNTQIQFNNSGVFGASANLTWDGTTLSAVGRLYNGSASTFGASTWGMSLGNGGVSANYFKASTTYWQNDSGTQIMQLGGGSLQLTSNLLFSADNTYDIGASGATRPRSIFLAGNVDLQSSGAQVLTTYGGVTTTRLFTDTGGGVLSVDGSNSISLRTGGVSGTTRLLVNTTGAAVTGTLSASGDVAFGAGASLTNYSLTLNSINATPASVRTVLTQSYNGQLTLNNDAGVNASTSSNRQFAFQIAGTQGLNLNQNGLFIGTGTVNGSWNSIFKVAQFGEVGTTYGSISNQVTANCPMNYGWNIYGTGDDTFAFEKTGDSASRIRQSGAAFYFNSSGATGTAGNPVVFYTPLSVTQTSASGTGGKVGVNVFAPNTAFQVLGPTISDLALQSAYTFGVGSGSGYDLVMGTDSSYAYIQTFGSKPLFFQNQGNAALFGSNVLVGATTTFNTNYSQFQLNGGTGTGMTLYATDNASGSYNQKIIAHRFNYTGTSQTDGARITFTRSSNVDGNYGSEIAIATRPNGGSLTTSVQFDSLQRTLQLAGRSSNAYAMGNCQEWVGQITSLANGGTASLFYINGIYDNLCYEIDVFVNAGGFFAGKYAGIFGYNGFTPSFTATNYGGFVLSRTGALYNETMTVTNNSGASINNYNICVRVWGYNTAQNVSTGGADLIVSSYLTRIK